MNEMQAMNQAMRKPKSPLSMKGAGGLTVFRAWLGLLLVGIVLTGCSLFSPAHAVDVWPKDWIPGGAITNGQLVTDSPLSVLPGAELFLEVGVANDNDLWVIRRKSDYSIVQQQNEADTITYKWTGSGTFTTANSRTTYWTAPQSSGTYTLTCTINDQPKPVIPPETGSRDDMPLEREITVRVIKVDELQYRLNSEDEFEDVPDPLYVPIGQTVEFKATKTPSSGSWPDGKPVWGGTSGASGSGVTTSVTFNTVSTTATDYKTVTAECGDTETANVIVFNVQFDGTKSHDYLVPGSSQNTIIYTIQPEDISLDSVNIEVKDKLDNLVRSLTGLPTEGDTHQTQWDGLDTNGDALTELMSSYTYKIEAKKNSLSAEATLAGRQIKEWGVSFVVQDRSSPNTTYETGVDEETIADEDGTPVNLKVEVTASGMDKTEIPYFEVIPDIGNEKWDAEVKLKKNEDEDWFLFYTTPTPQEGVPEISYTVELTQSDPYVQDVGGNTWDMDDTTEEAETKTTWTFGINSDGGIIDFQATYE